MPWRAPIRMSWRLTLATKCWTVWWPMRMTICRFPSHAHKPIVRVICVAEMGPVSAKSYAACRPSPQGERPQLAPRLWMTRQCLGLWRLCTAHSHRFHPGCRRTGHAQLHCLSECAGGTVAGGENHSHSRQPQHPRHTGCQTLGTGPCTRQISFPACLHVLAVDAALNGCCFASVTGLTEAIVSAAAYWNAHRQPYTWRKLYL